MTATNTNELLTALTRARYQRISSLYDRFEAISERRFSTWRKMLWSMVQGTNVLKVGVGTGKNMPFYSLGICITAIDLTPGMLDHAKDRAIVLNSNVDLRLGDVQRLNFMDNSFDRQ